MESLENAIEGLKYIADSPPQEHGGFHPNTVKIAKTALFHLEAEHTLRVAVEELREIYFIIAASAMGKFEVRKRRDEMINQSVQAMENKDTPNGYDDNGNPIKYGIR